MVKEDNLGTKVIFIDGHRINKILMKQVDLDSQRAISVNGTGQRHKKQKITIMNMATIHNLMKS